MTTPLCISDLARYAQFYDKLLALYERFGKVVFVPVSNDRRLRGHVTCFEATKTAWYLRELITQDLALRCGTASCALSAILFSEEHLLAHFLEHNPLLRHTALLVAPTGFTLFLCINGFQPQTNHPADLQMVGR